MYKTSAEYEGEDVFGGFITALTTNTSVAFVLHMNKKGETMERKRRIENWGALNNYIFAGWSGR